MHRPDWLTAATGGRVAAVVVVAALTGCTMCPDPHDYSGPVPNGSPPQNDFRSRSNGILPLGAAPRPWPPLVETSREDASGRTMATAREPRRHGVPTLAEPLPEADGAAASEADEAETASVLVVAAEDVVAVVPDVSDEPAHESPGPLDDVATDEETLVPPPSPIEAAEPLEPAPTEVPGLAETPGWRPRRLQ